MSSHTIPRIINNSKLLKEIEEENEIIELVYMRQILSFDKKFRQALVRKRRNLYIMLTNGVHFSMEEVVDSEVRRPYEIIHT